MATTGLIPTAGKALGFDSLLSPYITLRFGLNFLFGMESLWPRGLKFSRFWKLLSEFDHP